MKKKLSEMTTADLWAMLKFSISIHATKHRRDLGQHCQDVSNQAIKELQKRMEDVEL